MEHTQKEIEALERGEWIVKVEGNTLGEMVQAMIENTHKGEGGVNDHLFAQEDET